MPNLLIGLRSEETVPHPGVESDTHHHSSSADGNVLMASHHADCRETLQVGKHQVATSIGEDSMDVWSSAVSMRPDTLDEICESGRGRELPVIHSLRILKSA